MTPVNHGSQDNADWHKYEEPIDPTGEDDALDISNEAFAQGLFNLGLGGP